MEKIECFLFNLGRGICVISFGLIVSLFLFIWCKTLRKGDIHGMFDPHNIETYGRILGTFSSICFLFLSFDPGNIFKLIKSNAYDFLRKISLTFIVLIFIFIANLCLLALHTFSSKSYVSNTFKIIPAVFFLIEVGACFSMLFYDFRKFFFLIIIKRINNDI